MQWPMFIKAWDMWLPCLMKNKISNVMILR
jgi:hypothetical protein